MQPSLGLVGLGNIGEPICRRLLAHSFEVTAYDIAPAARERLRDTAASLASSLADLVACEVVLLSLPHSGIVEEVVLGAGGLAETLRAGAVIIDLSSSQPASTRRIATELATRDIALLDAPVSGGVPRARDGTLAVMVGGERALFERYRPILAAFSSTQFYIGPSGSGHVVKALNNLLSATTLASAAETLLLAQRAGIDPGLFVEVINASSGRSNSTEVKLPRYILTGSFADGFALGLMNKDAQIALATARELGVPLPIGALVASIWEAAAGAGLGPEGHTAIYRYLQERAATPPPAAEPAIAEAAAIAEQHESNRDNSTRGVASMATREEKQAYVDQMVRERGYVLDYHKAMAEADFETLQASNALIEAAYLRQRRLDRRTKELLFILSLTVMRAGKGHIQSHIRVALDLGVSAEEILEAIELALPEAGVVAFQAGFEAWREVVGIEGIQPTVKAHEGGSGTS